MFSTSTWIKWQDTGWGRAYSLTKVRFMNFYFWPKQINEWLEKSKKMASFFMNLQMLFRSLMFIAVFFFVCLSTRVNVLDEGYKL